MQFFNLLVECKLATLPGVSVACSVTLALLADDAGGVLALEFPFRP